MILYATTGLNIILFTISLTLDVVWSFETKRTDIITELIGPFFKAYA